MSPDGRRLAYADETGAWVADLPDGSPRRLVANVLTEDGGDRNRNLPFLWSPDGRYLVTDVRFIEGAGYDLWDVTSGARWATGAFNYAGPDTEFAFLQEPAGGLALTNPGGQGGSVLAIAQPAEDDRVARTDVPFRRRLAVRQEGCGAAASSS